LNHGADTGGFSCARVASNHEGASGLCAEYKAPHGMNQRPLSFGGTVGKMLSHSVDELFDLWRAFDHVHEGKWPNLTKAKNLAMGRICGRRDVS
jgi:hypothetical protein